jgi:hypothetical protein
MAKGLLVVTEVDEEEEEEGADDVVLGDSDSESDSDSDSGDDGQNDVPNILCVKIVYRYHRRAPPSFVSLC